MRHLPCPRDQCKGEKRGWQFVIKLTERSRFGVFGGIEYDLACFLDGGFALRSLAYSIPLQIEHYQPLVYEWIEIFFAPAFREAIFLHLDFSPNGTRFALVLFSKPLVSILPYDIFLQIFARSAYCLLEHILNEISITVSIPISSIRMLYLYYRAFQHVTGLL
jgi:hypothetical protein